MAHTLAFPEWLGNRLHEEEGVFQIIGPTKRGIEKGVADGIVAAIRRPRAQGIGPKPPRLKRGDAVRILKGLLAHSVGLYHGMKPHERIEVLLSLLEGHASGERRIGGIGMSVRLPDDDIAFYWPPPTSCRRGNVPNSKSTSLPSCGRILTPSPARSTRRWAPPHGLQVASPAPRGRALSAVGAPGTSTISVDMAWTRSPGDLATIARLPVNL